MNKEKEFASGILLGSGLVMAGIGLYLHSPIGLIAIFLIAASIMVLTEE